MQNNPKKKQGGQKRSVSKQAGSKQGGRVVGMKERDVSV